MSDLVKRLRRDADSADLNYPEVFCVSTDLAREAAGRIEELEWALRQIEENEDQFEMHWAADVARAALGENAIRALMEPGDG